MIRPESMEYDETRIWYQTCKPCLIFGAGQGLLSLFRQYCQCPLIREIINSFSQQKQMASADPNAHWSNFFHLHVVLAKFLPNRGVGFSVCIRY